MNAPSDREWSSPRALIDGLQAELPLAYEEQDAGLFRAFFDLPLYVVTAAQTLVISTEAECAPLAESLFAIMDEQRCSRINAESVRVRHINHNAASVDLTLGLMTNTGERPSGLSATCTLTRKRGAGWRIFTLILTFGSNPASR